jgi:hypothetical protein
MLLIRYGYVVSARALFGALSAAVLALALLEVGVVNAQELKQIKLTEKHIQSFIAAHEEMTKLYEATSPDKPDPKRDAQAEAIVKRNGFGSLDEHSIVTMNILMILSGIDPQTKQFTEPPEQIRRDIAAIKAEKSIPEAEKKQVLAQLEVALKDARPIQFKENVALVIKYYDQLPPLMHEQGTAD